MNTLQIESILSHDPFTASIFAGVYARDTLPFIDSGCCIFNTAPSHEKHGHWIALFITKNSVEYFDSYGGKPSILIKKIMRKKNWKHNPFTLQSPLSAVCGQYCVYYLYHRARGQSMRKILSVFDPSDVDENDETVHKFVENMFGVDIKLLDTYAVVNQLAKSMVS